MDYADFFSDPEQGNEYISKYLEGVDPFADDAEVLAAMRDEYKSFA